jgi:hypothetical protein
MNKHIYMVWSQNFALCCHCDEHFEKCVMCYIFQYINKADDSSNNNNNDNNNNDKLAKNTGTNMYQNQWKQAGEIR